MMNVRQLLRNGLAQNAVKKTVPKQVATANKRAAGWFLINIISFKLQHNMVLCGRNEKGKLHQISTSLVV